MPVYLVTVKIPEAGPDKRRADATAERMVEAKNEAAALKFVVADTITIDRLSTADAVRLGAAGVEIEQA